nr:MAG: hypothetical protein [Microviridae sp.]
MIYQIKKREEASITGVNVYTGESIEQKIKRIMEDKEPISDGIEAVYTAKNEGILPSTNIRTDRFDAALDAMEIANKAKAAQREEKAKKKDEIGEKAKEGMKLEGEGEK